MQEALARSRREVQTLTQQARTHEAALQRERKDKEKAQRQLKQVRKLILADVNEKVTNDSLLFCNTVSGYENV